MSDNTEDKVLNIRENMEVTNENYGVMTFQGPEPDSIEYLRFQPDGKVFVRGELVDDNQKIYESFKAWLDRVLDYDPKTKTVNVDTIQ